VALLELDAEAAADVIAEHAGVSVAGYSSPRQTVVAGPPAQVDVVISAVQRQDRFARRVNMEVASHTALMDPILPELRWALTDLTPARPAIRFISTVIDADTPAFDADYWVANLRQPVRLAQAIATARQDHATFIEISPHPTLAYAITETLESPEPDERTLVTSSMNRADDQSLYFHARLAEVGVPPPTGKGGYQLADIPTTPWQHSAFWIPDRSSAWSGRGIHPLLGVHTEVPTGYSHIWQADIGSDIFPWLADYRVHGQAIMPAAGFAEIMLAAATEALDLPAHAVSIRQFTVEQMLPLEHHTPITTQLTRCADKTIRVEVHSRLANGDWCRHAVARVDTSADDVVPEVRDRFFGSLGTAISPADFYAHQHHGEAFAALVQIVRLPQGVSEAEIIIPDEAPRYAGCRVHPVMLDAAVQVLLAAMPHRGARQSAMGVYLPVSFEMIRIFGEVGRHARCRAELVSSDDSIGEFGRVVLTDDAGKPTAEIAGVHLRSVEREAIPLPLYQKLFEAEWVESPVPAPAMPSGSAASPGSWLVLYEGTDAKTAEAEFARQWCSPTRRVITANLVDESAVLAAFAEAAEDPERPPVGVVVSIGNHSLETTDPYGALEAARDAIWSVIAAVRAVIGGWHGRLPRLWLLSRAGLTVCDNESGDPAIGALRGLVRVLAYEHPELCATVVDLGADADALLAMNAEVASAGYDDVIAWRGQRRFVERLTRVHLDRGNCEPVVRPDGAYVITGGLGGLGLVVARWLVDSGARRVVLNGRSQPSEDQLKVVGELRSRCDIVVMSGDIAAAGVAERLVAAAEATGLRLRG
ncbi:MAG: polyketide synthase dehydratase domain-containing protein, partial [Mycobacterium sp.]|nr:polyketide synthase dehydratase domain-containing protein [Mycobacterium sp.]